MDPWYAETALLTIGALITGHLWGIMAAKQPLDEAYYAGLDDGVVKGRELERLIHSSNQNRSLWQ